MRANRLPKGSFPLLREALLAGEFERCSAPSITGYKERMARNVLSKLLELGLLTSPGPKAPIRLGFPVNVIERWFPSLFPRTRFKGPDSPDRRQRMIGQFVVRKSPHQHKRTAPTRAREKCSPTSMKWLITEPAESPIRSSVEALYDQ